MRTGVAGRYSPIGVDIGAREVLAVQLVREHAGVRVHRAARPPIRATEAPEGADWLGSVWETLVRRGFRGRRVVVCASGGATKSSVVECPRVEAAGALDEIVRAELSRAHRLEAGRFEMAWWPLPGRANKGATVLACASEHAGAREIDERFARLGVEVTALDLRSLALSRACAGMLSTDPSVLDAIVEVGWDRSRVLVVGGGAVLYERELAECGLSRACAQAASEIMSDAQIAEAAIFRIGAEGGGGGVLAPTVRTGVTRLGETIGGELGVSISYAVRNYGLAASGRIVCAGEGAAIPGLCAVIGEGGGMPAGVWAAPGDATGMSPAMAVAWGLAARFD